MICAFTGHRPEHLPWGSDERDPRCAALKTLLRQRLRELSGRDMGHFCAEWRAGVISILPRPC